MNPLLWLKVGQMFSFKSIFEKETFISVRSWYMSPVVNSLLSKSDSEAYFFKNS